VDDLGYGRMIWLDVTDPQGKPAGEHAAVILTTKAERDAGHPIKAIVISSKKKYTTTDRRVSIPHAQGRHIYTNLDKESWAICDWEITVDTSKINRRKGRIPDKYLYQIVECRKRNPSTQS
jgi:hypothetical protein